MRSLLGFVAGVTLAIIVQVSTAGANADLNGVDVAALKVEIELLKTELATAKVDINTRLNNLELQTGSLQNRTAAIESAEPKLIPAYKSLRVEPR